MYVYVEPVHKHGSVASQMHFAACYLRSGFQSPKSQMKPVSPYRRFAFVADCQLRAPAAQHIDPLHHYNAFLADE